MIITSDDASYLRPPENFTRTGVWKDNSEGVSSYIQRPPGTGLLHLLFYNISPHDHSILHKFFALLLHVLALYVFGIIALELFGRRWSVFVQLIYAILPCFWGYLFYYITESITPSLIVFLFFAYVKYHYWPSSKWLIWQAALSGLILITRPQLIIFTFPFIYFLIDFLRGKNPKKMSVLVLAFLLAFGGFIAWQIRSTTIAKRFVGLHGIYDVTNNSQYRPIHRSFGELFKIWECDGEYFHTLFTNLWINGHRADLDTMETWIAGNHVRLYGCKGITNLNIRDLLIEYHEVVHEMAPLNDKASPLNGEPETEKNLRLKVDKLTKRIRTQNLVLCYIKTPFRSAKFIFTKSQLNLFIFQKTYRGIWWMEMLRYTCLFLIVLSTLLSLLNIFNRRNKPIFLFAGCMILYLFYLFFIQKINEERYLMPLLPIILLNGIYTIFEWRKYMIKSQTSVESETTNNV